MMVGFLPSIFAKKAIRARDFNTDAFLRYFTEGGLDQGAAEFVRNRHNFAASRGFSLRDIAQLEVISAIGIISNSMPAAFWVLYHIFSNPTVLKDCRAS